MSFPSDTRFGIVLPFWLREFSCTLFCYSPEDASFRKLHDLLCLAHENNAADLRVAKEGTFPFPAVAGSVEIRFLKEALYNTLNEH